MSRTGIMLNGLAVSTLGLARSALVFPVPCCCGGGPCNPIANPECPIPDCTSAIGGTQTATMAPGSFVIGPETACFRCCNGVGQFLPGRARYVRDTRDFLYDFSTTPNPSTGLYLVDAETRSVSTTVYPGRVLSGVTTIRRRECFTTPGNPGCVTTFQSLPFGGIDPVDPVCAYRGIQSVPGDRCGSVNPGYTCNGREEIDCDRYSFNRADNQVSPGGSRVATFRQISNRIYNACDALPGGACCCNNRCYERITSGCGSQYWPGLRCDEIPIRCDDPLNLGACCHDGTCIDGISGDLCRTISGTFYPGLACVQVMCGDGTGACCFPNGTCQQLNQQQCELGMGTWGGPGSSCGTTFCPVVPTGACCTPIGCVGGLTQSQCLAQGGSGWFSGQACTPNLCGGTGQPMACCIPGQQCQSLPCGECTAQGGTCLPQEFCNPFICAFGACCRPDGSCSQTYRGICEATPGAVFIEGQPCSACPTQQTNPFNQFPPRDFIRIFQPGDVARAASGCATCKGVGAIPL